MTQLLCSLVLCAASLYGQQSIAMYSNGGLTGTESREVTVPPQARGRAYLVTLVLTAGISPLNVFPISVIVERSDDGVTWFQQDVTRYDRDIDTGPLTPVVMSSVARIESLSARYRVTVSVGQSVVAVAVNLERI